MGDITNLHNKNKVLEKLDCEICNVINDFTKTHPNKIAVAEVVGVLEAIKFRLFYDGKI